MKNLWFNSLQIFDPILKYPHLFIRIFLVKLADLNVIHSLRSLIWRQEIIVLFFIFSEKNSLLESEKL